jgi:leader peptidase (prepilin peptidase)/N-methyltransferase
MAVLPLPLWIFLFALLGLVAGVTINTLADDWPLRRPPRRPRCLQCGQPYEGLAWMAIGRYLARRGRCPECGHFARRHLLVEVGLTLGLMPLPLLIGRWPDAAVYAFYLAVLVLIIVTDVEHRLILHKVTLPATLLAFLGSLVVADNSLPLALAGAGLGFLFFLSAFWLGQWLFGPGALGFGDVTLAMTMGAMLGLHRVVFALVLAIILGALAGLILLASGRKGRRSTFAYGPFLALAAMVMLIWGNQVVAWYTGGG